jgi:hypothetical protein
MSNVSKELAALLKAVEERKANSGGLKRNNMTYRREQSAFDMWRFMQVQHDEGIDEGDEPPTYEEILAHLEEHWKSPEKRAEFRYRMWGAPIRGYPHGSTEIAGAGLSDYEFLLAEEVEKQPWFDEHFDDPGEVLPKDI